MTHVPMGESWYFFGVILDSKRGNQTVIEEGGSLFADSEKLQLYFQKAFLIKLN